MTDFHSGTAAAMRRVGHAATATVLVCGLAACGITIGEPTKTTQESTMQDTEFSQLDADGVARIKESGVMRLDFTGDAIAKADVGLSGSAIAPDVVAPDGTKLALSVQGSNGILSAETDHVRFTSTSSLPDIYVMYYFLTATNLPDYAQLVQDGVAAYGMDSDAAERWLDSTEADPGRKSDYSLGSGDKLGFDVGYELSYDGSKDVQVIVVTVSKPLP
ncbi:hypothetical protein [Arthrobacter sp. H35-D1]|uniref:hypothetical protein n=1 Tax=Arthrobacter sp. H35-D1 TaxID=3046202 RepID=UPI0024B93D21|nr:hypothetical protein [Arthrobacter sp. H35-D1]MDJ0311693.1 hypothetical protein [Arthrobacter sp. H35-D1]